MSWPLRRVGLAPMSQDQHLNPWCDCDDAELMSRLAAGQIRDAIAALYQRHNADLFNFIAWLCRGDLSEAEELTQAVWERLMTRAHRYQEHGQLRAYLFQMARNLRQDRLRRSGRETPLDEPSHGDTAVDPAPLPMEQITTERDLETLRQEVMNLPDEQREAIILRFHAELSLEEIAQAVESPIETVKSRLRYAYARLRRGMRVSS